MDQELKTKWVEALRSGKYKQATKVLRDSQSGGFCCLGVLLDISDTGKWAHDHFVTDDGCYTLYGELESYGRCFGLLTSQEATLINMNDGSESKGVRPHSFAEIADYIEKNL